MSRAENGTVLCQDCKTRDFFDPAKEFFLIDSECLDQVESRFYGFSVQSSGIYEQDNLTKAAADALDGCGAYVYVERMEDGQIRIRQDFNGSWGIYLFRSGDYFALSNSFHRLLEYLKGRFPLTLDRDYANQFLSPGLCSHAYSETAVKEIRLIDKDAIILIDTKTPKLRLTYTDYAEESIPLDTPEGMAVLDRWFLKWTTLLRNLKARTNNISLNLSGGFDSRVSFLLALCAGIDLNDIRMYSIHDTLHTHAEDYEIASEIADAYGFKLNNKGLGRQALHYSLKDSLSLSFYTKLTTHKQMFYKSAKFAERRYIIPGTGGGVLRRLWSQTAQDFIDLQVYKVSDYSLPLRKEFSDSICRIHQAAFQAVDEKFGLDGKDSTRYPARFYRLTRCRHHFGKEAVERLLCNEYELSPLLDPAVRSLKLETAECQDRNLLFALIYVRYCPKLLSFRFEGGRSIAPETIAYARRLNNVLPRPQAEPPAKADESFHVITRDEAVIRVLQANENNPALPIDAPVQYVKAVFDSCSFQKLFETCFDGEIYGHAKQHATETDFQPLQEYYAVIGITTVIGDVLASRQLCQPTIMQSLDSFIEENPYEPEDLVLLLDRFRDDLTARIDLRLTGFAAAFDLAWLSDPRAMVTQPKQLQKNVMGYVVEAYRRTLDLKLHIRTEGTLTFRLGSKEARKGQDAKPSCWIAYQSVQYNGSEQLQSVSYACHREPFLLSRPVKAGDTVTLHLEWIPCRAAVGKKHSLEKKIASLEKKLAAQEKENAALRSSLAWRLGRILTWPVRKLKLLLSRQRR